MLRKSAVLLACYAVFFLKPTLGMGAEVNPVNIYQDCLDQGRQKLADLCKAASLATCNDSSSPEIAAYNKKLQSDCRVSQLNSLPVITGTTSASSDPAPTDSNTPGQNLPSARPPVNFASVPTPPRRPSFFNTPQSPSSPAQANQQPSQQQQPKQQPTPTPKVDSTPRSANSETADTAQTHADSDIATCTSASSEAVKCCGSPTACVSNLRSEDQVSVSQLQQLSNQGPASGQSLTDYCTQLQQLSAKSGNVNTGFAAVCATDQNSCKNTCSQLAQKYQSLLDSCDGCSGYSVYQDTLATLQDTATSCGNLQAKADQLGSQGLSSAIPQGRADMCHQLAAATAQSVGNPTGSMAGNSLASSGANDPYGCLANPGSAGCQDCRNNPSSAACRTLAAASSAVDASHSSTGFSNDGGPSKNSQFNVQPPPLVSGQSEISVTQPQAQKVFTVANNGGGGIPGSGGSSNPATLDSGAKNRAMNVMPSSYSTDIDQGTRSGGYSQPTSSNSYDGSGPRNAPAARAPTKADDGLFGMRDLMRQFLPGGRRDPNRNVAGLGPGNVEINGKGVDLFKKISTKMEEKCKLGVLWECRP